MKIMNNKQDLSVKMKGFKIGGILIGGIIGGMILSFVYVYLLMFFSHTILRVLVIIGTAGAAAGWMVWLLRWGNIRDPHWQRVLLGAEVLVLYYSQWALYTNLVEDAWLVGMEQLWEYHFTFPQIFTRWVRRCAQPGLLTDMMGELVYRGFLSINGQIIKGGQLILLWIAEGVSLLGLPLWIMGSRMKVPYDEKEKVWLNKEEERTISYIKNYRELRKKIQQREAGENGFISEEIKAYCPEKGEPFGLITFFRKGSHVGPYISLVNVREISAGEKRRQRQYISVAEKIDIGEEARTIYEKLGLPEEKETGAILLTVIKDTARKIMIRKRHVEESPEESEKVYEGNEEVLELEEILPKEERQ